VTHLGSTGLAVSRIGLGLAALGRPGYINLGHAEDLRRRYDVEAMRARTHEVLDAAWNAGVRYFDAARSYGRAEEFLSGWLSTRAIRPAAVTVGSKWGYTYTAGWQAEAEEHEVKDHSIGALSAQLVETRHLLGGHLDLYQIHSATLESGVLDDSAVLECLARLRQEGLRIGLTVSGAGQVDALRRALEVRTYGERLFDCVQATWNLLDRSVGDALREAHEAGLGVIVKEALANGRLTERNTDPSFVTRRHLLEAESQRLGATIDALALAAVLARPWADVVLSGASTAAQLRSNLRAQRVQWDEEAERRLLSVAETAGDYWTCRGRLRWN
jgi:aryl-alcohol dehydrogenase-like predicted oxidoreductase